VIHRTKNLRVSDKTAVSPAVLFSSFNRNLMGNRIWSLCLGLWNHSSCGRTSSLTRKEPGSDTGGSTPEQIKWALPSYVII
jgi:hypothetical protein